MSEKKILSKAEILRADDIRTIEVTVPEWGGSVLLRGLTGRERDLFEESILDQSGKKTKVRLKNARARLIALSMVDEDGNHVFNENEIAVLGEKSSAALDRVYSEAARISGISDDDMDELLKNGE